MKVIGKMADNCILATFLICFVYKSQVIITKPRQAILQMFPSPLPKSKPHSAKFQWHIIRVISMVWKDIQ